MNGPVQWTPNGFVSAVVSSSQGVRAPIVMPTSDEDDDNDEAPALARPTQAKKTAPAAPAKSVNVVQMARARLRDVEAEIKRLKKLEKERDELRRLIDAAKAKPRAAVVRTLTRTAG